MKNENKYHTESNIESVGLTIRSKDGQVKEIPLEVWQVDIICQMLGLQVNLSDFNDYKMTSKENVDTIIKTYHLLQWLQGWYNRFCWDEKRHYYGIKIETLDNPGWSVKIEICDTPLENKTFQEIRQDNGDTDWMFCKVENGIFYGAGDPDKLIAILEIFREWTQQDQH